MSYCGCGSILSLSQEVTGSNPFTIDLMTDVLVTEFSDFNKNI